jgi:hypothetical protein
MKIRQRLMNLSKTEIFILFLFAIGFYFCSNYTHSDVIEGFSLTKECPNTLIRKGKELHLIYNNKPKIAGINPVKFNNLEEYVEFVEYQKKVGKSCPVLYLQETETTQGTKGLRVLDDPIDPSVGLRSVGPPKLINPDPQYVPDARKDQSKYNTNMLTGYDPEEQNVGVQTPMDRIVDGGSQSADPMAKNWGGHKTTYDAVKGGRYQGRTREGSNNPFKDSKFISTKPK